jgi:dienelactone hydrolase
MFRLLLFLIILAITLPAFAVEPPAPRDVELTAPDALKLKATYYAAAKPGPGVLLLHMCNSNRKAWEPLARQLSAAGIHALALDYRGFGESGGDRFENDPQRQQQVMAEKFPGDIDAAFTYLAGQPGVDKSRMGAAGGSCGVNHAIQVARRHPEVKSLVLLAGGTDRQGRQFIQQNRWLPIFAASAEDDQYGSEFEVLMRWILNLSGNPRNKFVGFKTGGHGTEIFTPHPELPKQIVAWYVDTLVKAPADPKAPVAVQNTPVSEFWAVLDQPGGVAKAVQMFRDARKRDPNAYLFPETMMNLFAYERMQAGQVQDAIQLCKLNIEAYPNSANAYDSLGDAYLAAGQKELALQATQQSLALLPADKSNEELKKLIRKSAEQKLQKLQPAPGK